MDVLGYTACVRFLAELASILRIEQHPVYRLQRALHQLPDNIRVHLVDYRADPCSYLFRPEDLAQLPSLLDRALRIAFRITENGFDAMGAVAQALHNIARYPKAAENFDALFMTTVANCAREIVRRRVRRKAREIKWAQEPPHHMVSPSAEKLAIDAETVVMVRKAVAELPRKQQAVTELHYFEGLSRPEIAVRLSLPESTVNSRLYQARRHLKQSLSAVA